MFFPAVPWAFHPSSCEHWSLGVPDQSRFHNYSTHIHNEWAQTISVCTLTPFGCQSLKSQMLMFHYHIHMHVEHTCEKEHDVRTVEAMNFLLASYVKCMLVCWLNKYYKSAQKLAADQLRT